MTLPPVLSNHRGYSVDSVVCDSAPQTATTAQHIHHLRQLTWGGNADTALLTQKTAQATFTTSACSLIIGPTGNRHHWKEHGMV
uniref:Uncharacterized protein n=1 Tax=Echinococcus granulosus TaxID=6210 RepID=A0A068WUD3_ECHGR|nr:hypothetical protein EgrG_002045400 [Echinococcus granulosus]